MATESKTLKWLKSDELVEERVSSSLHISTCPYCGLTYADNAAQDIVDHKKLHERKMLAEKVFGHIATSMERDAILGMVSKKCKGSEGYIFYKNYLEEYFHWSRSIEGNNFDLLHPSLQEYSQYYLKRDIDWLPYGKSYVNMKIYKNNISKPVN